MKAYLFSITTVMNLLIFNSFALYLSKIVSHARFTKELSIDFFSFLELIHCFDENEAFFVAKGKLSLA